MKLQVMQVFESSGISKKTGKPFTMFRAGVIVPLRDIETPTYQRRGSGFGVEELMIADSAYPEIKAWFDANLKAALYIEAEFSTSFDRGQTLILGFPRAAVSFSGSKTGTNG
jgi:hypothetical protein